jgi:hypothetical protein
MPPGRPLRLPVHRACDALSRDPHTYNYWATEGLLYKPERGEGITEQQAVEWAVLQALREKREIKPSAFRAIWAGLRKQLGSALAQGTVVVWISSRPREARLSLRADEVVEFATKGSGAIPVDATHYVQAVRAVYRSARDKVQRKKTRDESSEAL